MEKPLVVIALFFTVAANAQIFKIGSYKVTSAKLAGWSVNVIGGAADGIFQGYGFENRTSFERKYGVDPYGFWGSQSWRNVYKGGEPANGFKSPIHRWMGAVDAYHMFDDMHKWCYMSGSVVLGIGGAKSNTKWWHYAADFTISFALSAVAKSAGMAYIRN